MDFSNFMKRLTTEMTWNDVSEIQLAARSNIAPERVRLILSGSEPSVTEILAFADVFNCSVDYLLHRTEISQVALQAPLLKCSLGFYLRFIKTDRQRPFPIDSFRKMAFIAETDDSTLTTQQYEMYYGYCTREDGWRDEEGDKLFPFTRVVAYAAL